MNKVINGIQQIGIGVYNAEEVFNWYRKYLGFDILVFKDEAEAALMKKYTNNKIYSRLALLSLNMLGGGGLEIWQFKNKAPEPSRTKMFLGDLGINSMKIRSNNINHSYTLLENFKLKSQSESGIYNSEHFFISDPWDNIIQIIHDEYQFSKTGTSVGGVLGAIFGVSNMDASLSFYQQILGYDVVESDRSGVFDDFINLPGGSYAFRRVVLKHSKRDVGGFGELLGPTSIELLQVLNRQPNKIYENRIWGDIGFIHICFDINGMKAFREEAKALNYPFTIDSSDSFDMGEAAGHFSYIEDPDGTLIEFVETHKVPIVKKLGIYINMKKRNPFKPLPKWLVKAMKVHRIKRDI